MAKLAERVDDRRLSALEVADEVPPEPRAVPVVLGLEVLCAVLADDLDSRVREQADPSTVTYFVATTTVTSAPTSSLTRAYRSRSSSIDVGNDSLASGLRVIAAV